MTPESSRGGAKAITQMPMVRAMPMAIPAAQRKDDFQVRLRVAHSTLSDSSSTLPCNPFVIFSPKACAWASPARLAF